MVYGVPVVTPMHDVLVGVASPVLPGVRCWPPSHIALGWKQRGPCWLAGRGLQCRTLLERAPDDTTGPWKRGSFRRAARRGRRFCVFGWLVCAVTFASPAARAAIRTHVRNPVSTGRAMTTDSIRRLFPPHGLGRHEHASCERSATVPTSLRTTLPAPVPPAGAVRSDLAADQSFAARFCRIHRKFMARTVRRSGCRWICLVRNRRDYRQFLSELGRMEMFPGG